MVLAIDIGNTNVVVGCFQDEEILFVERISTRQSNTALEYAVSFKSILEIYKISVKDIEGSIISSVVPSVTNTVKRAVETITQKDALIVNYEIRTDLKIDIENPHQLGNDLIVAAVAAMEQYEPPIAIIDMGTATTISVIDKTGTYIGGMILPGVAISMSALSEKTAQLPKIALESPKRFIGTNTVDCMKSGILYGTACSIDGLLDQIESELNMPVKVLATGGLSNLIIPYCRREIILDDMMLLKGLKIIYQKNIQ